MTIWYTDWFFILIWQRCFQYATHGFIGGRFSNRCIESWLCWFNIDARSLLCRLSFCLCFWYGPWALFLLINALNNAQLVLCRSNRFCRHSKFGSAALMLGEPCENLVETLAWLVFGQTSLFSRIALSYVAWSSWCFADTPTRLVPCAVKNDWQQLYMPCMFQTFGFGLQQIKVWWMLPLLPVLYS